jgi:thymidylate synthase
MAFNTDFKEIILDIDSIGSTSQPRDMKVKELIVDQRSFNPTQTIANFENRKFNWKYFAGELAWYLEKNRDVDFIGKFSGFWSTLTNPNTNEINSNYGSLLFGDQLQWVLDSLKADKNTRQAIAFLNQPKFQFEGNKDFVCTMYLNFFIRDNKLNMKVQMRSNDIFYGLTFDAPFFAFLLQSIHIKLIETYPDLQLGDYYHFADNLHFYERHFELATAIQTEEPIKDADNNFVIKEKFIDYDGENVFMTPFAEAYCKEVYETIGEDHSTPNQESYKKLLEKYFIL